MSLARLVFRRQTPAARSVADLAEELRENAGVLILESGRSYLFVEADDSVAATMVPEGWTMSRESFIDRPDTRPAPIRQPF